MSFLIVKSSERILNLESSSASSFLCGEDSSLCNRSKFLDERFLEVNTSLPQYKIKYLVEEQAVQYDRFNIYPNSSGVSDILGEYPAINLSSIDVGEIWILLRLLANNEFSGLDFYYLTPDGYGGSGVGELVERNQVSISGGRWRGLPGLITPWNIDDIDFREFSFLGFDVHRLGSIESYEGFPDNLNRTFVLADPPTAPCWLERSLRDNHELISDIMHDGKSITPIERMAGMCPATVNSQLQKIKNIAPDNQRWCLLPLGPKIQTLGTILFTSNQLEVTNSNNEEPTVGVLYDFPKPNANITRIERTPSYYWKFRVETLND